MAFSKETAFELLGRAQKQGRLAHAYLITGPEGSGKEELVADLIRMVCPSTSKDPMQHPDVHTAKPESKSRRIVIEQIRELEHELQMRASMGGLKVGVIFEADRMQIQASNAFLKTLEEPPRNSLLLLTSSIPEALPDTILSRCISVHLISEPESNRISPEQQQLLSRLRDFFRSGSRDLAHVYGLLREFTSLLGTAKEQIQEQCQTLFSEEEALYKKTSDGRYLEEREEYYKALAESRYVQTRFLFVDTLIQWWADVLRQQQGFEQLDYPGFKAETAALAEKTSSQRTLKRIADLETLREHFNRNVQELLAAEVIFLRVFQD